jgi:primosomal protein N' (replication factor Y)
LAEEGLATQKLEEVIRNFFPDLAISRIDGDAPVSSRQETISMTGDILIGTQMIAKGHDFREVTLGIILETDRMLSLPDYRSEERAFELIIQLAGRVGRHLPGGRVVLMTQNPKDKIFEEIQSYDMEHFFERTSRERLELFYPPHRKITLLSLWSRKESIILETCQQALFERSPLPGVLIQGPVAAPVARAKGEFHYQFLIRAENITGIHQALDRASLLFGGVKGLSINWSVDPPDLF